MKTKFISYFLFLLAMSLFAACGDDDNTNPNTDPDPTPETTVNTFIYKGKTVEAKSVICTDYFKGYYCIYMSPLMNLATIEDFIGSGREYLTFMVPQASINQEMSLMDESNGCTLYYMDENSNSILASHDEETWENVSDGKVIFKMEENAGDGTYKVNASFNITFKDGKTFTGIASSSYTPPTPLSNQVACGDEVRDIKSAYAMMFQGNQIIYLSPVANLTTAEDIADTEDYMFLAFNPNKIGQDIDITTEESIYTIWHTLTWQDATILEKEIAITNDSWSDYCTNGTFKIESLQDNTVKLSFDITLSSGKTFRGAYEGPCIIEATGPASDNILTVNDVTQDIKSAFYMKYKGSTLLYLTPSYISDFSSLDNVNTYYVSVTVPDEALDGREIQLNSADDFSVMYYNPGSEEQIYNAEGSGTGTYSVKAGQAEDEYEVTINVEIDGMTISGKYNGKFMSDAPAVKENEYTLGDNDPVAIHSVVIDKQSDATMCDVYLANQSGLTTVDAIKAVNPIIIRIPQDALDGEQQAFSLVPSMSITYNEVVYNYDSVKNNNLLDGGNATITLDGNNAKIEFTLFTIKQYNASLTGYYNGSVTIIE